MSEFINQGAIKVIEIIGISPTSFEDAVQQAVTKASKSVRGITGCEVLSQSVGITDGKVTQYRAAVKLAFVVD
jgi:dodecin